jgi:hypothetical protein
MSELAGLEEIDERSALHVNGRTGFGWSIPPSIERARASREGKAIEKPAALIPDDEKDRQTMTTLGGPQETTIISYNELIAGIQARIAELGIRQVDFDKLACWADGLSGKVFGPARVKRLGPEKLFDALRAAGLRLKLEPDPEQLQKLSKQIAEHCRPRQSNQARPGHDGRLRAKGGGRKPKPAAKRQAKKATVKRGKPYLAR